MFEVYKDYDGNSPDTAPVLVTKDETVAKAVAAFMNGLPDDLDTHCSDGHEWSARWRYRRYYAPDEVEDLDGAKDVIFREISEAIMGRDNLANSEQAREVFDKMWANT